MAVNIPRIGWNKYFMNIAKEVAFRSPDPKRKVGSIVVDNNKRIISSGYNGLPKGMDDDFIFSFKDRPTVLKMVIHAEVNAIIYAKQDLTNNILYTTLSPCPECIKIIAASGINKVFYDTPHKSFEETIILAELMNIVLNKVE